MSRKKREIKRSGSDSKLDRKKLRHTVKSVHVYPDDGGWRIKKSGSSRYSRGFKTKKDAVVHGRSLAKKTSDALVIHNRNGKIQRQDSYGRDAFPPKD